MPLTLDHLVWVVADLDAAAQRVRRRHGLSAVAGGRHPGWGTANRIIPLGRGYLELLAVVDPEEADADPMGRAYRRLRADAEGDRLALWCLATDDVEAVAARLGLAVQAKSRVLPDGTRIGWRSAGLEVALGNPALPFFIAWEEPADRHPATMQAAHDVEPHGISWVSVGADPAELARWLGGETLPVRLEGPPGINAVGIATAAGEIVIR